MSGVATQINFSLMNQMCLCDNVSTTWSEKLLVNFAISNVKKIRVNATVSCRIQKSTSA